VVKTKLIILGVLLGVNGNIFSQHCDSVFRIVESKNVKYYLVDTTLSYSELERIVQNSGNAEKSNALVILQKGVLVHDIKCIFLKNGFLADSIKFDEFIKILPSEIKFTSKERKLAKSYQRLADKEIKNTMRGKSNEEVHKRMSDKKFEIINQKYQQSIPLLLILGPQYRYKNYTLIYYSRYFTRRDGPEFTYIVCAD
jgi:hypothetical protein